MYFITIVERFYFFFSKTCIPIVHTMQTINDAITTIIIATGSSIFFSYYMTKICEGNSKLKPSDHITKTSKPYCILYSEWKFPKQSQKQMINPILDFTPRLLSFTRFPGNIFN